MTASPPPRRTPKYRVLAMLLWAGHATMRWQLRIDLQRAAGGDRT